jgi:hypothetical protein
MSRLHFPVQISRPPTQGLQVQSPSPGHRSTIIQSNVILPTAPWFANQDVKKLQYSPGKSADIQEKVVIDQPHHKL